MPSPVRAERLYNGAVERLVLDRPRANLIDAAMIDALRGHLLALADRPQLRLVVIEGAGAHFSFGASVQEHLPGEVRDMLRAFRGLFQDIEALGAPTAAVVRGRCLGGGCELATWCGRVFCDPSALFAQPEVKLAVFPPIAPIGLRWRIGGARAAELVLTGRTVAGPEAAAMGLADQCDEDPEAAWRAWYEAHLAPLSPAAARFTWRAARAPLGRALAEELPALEALYLDDLMNHPDAVEGLTAFIERRDPVWRSA